MEEIKDAVEIDGLDDLETQNTSIDEIDSENINLMFIGIDGSGSMSMYAQDMKDSLKDFKQALYDSKECDEILVARADFDNDVTIGGYKKISEFDTSFSPYGMTAMYDCVTNGTDKLIEYMKFLKNEGMRVKSCFCIFSDGAENASHSSFSEAKRAIESLNKEEITTAFISFGSEAMDDATRLGFKNILHVGASAKELRNAFNCLSKSVIESSKSVVADADKFFM